VGRCITRAKWQGCESQVLEGRQVAQRNEVINTGRCNLLPPINLPSSAFFLNPSTTKRHKFARLFGSKMSLSIKVPDAQFTDHSENVNDQSRSATATRPADTNNASPSPSPGTANKENRELSSKSAILSTPLLKPPDNNASPSVTVQTPDKRLPAILGTEGYPHSTSPDYTASPSTKSAHTPGREYLRTISTENSSLSAIPLLDNALSLQAFDLFPKLPFELRFRIWKSIDKLSTHDIRITVTTPSKEADIKKKPTFKLHTPVPIILHICHESREQGLTTYRALFKVKDRSGIERDEIYLNPALDTVFVSIPRCTRDWIIYTGGHVHPSHPSVATPFDEKKHNIFRSQVSNPPQTLRVQKEDRETIVVVQPTTNPLEAQSNERFTFGFDALARVAGEPWKSVEYYVWKPEWWNEHWEFLFTELMKEEPEEFTRKGKKRKKKLPAKPALSRKGQPIIGW
jgi:hypothetical protein